MGDCAGSPRRESMTDLGAAILIPCHWPAGGGGLLIKTGGHHYYYYYYYGDPGYEYYCYHCYFYEVYYDCCRSNRPAYMLVLTCAPPAF